MTQRQFLIDLIIILDNIQSPVDMQRGVILTYLKMAIQDRICKRYRDADEALEAAWKHTRAMIEQLKEAGF